MIRRRTKLAEGIYADRWGLAGTVKVGRQQRERRFPHDTDHDLIRSWQIEKRAELDAQRRWGDPTETPEPARGTFAGDLPRYLKKIAGRISFKSDRSHLTAWLPFIGETSRSKVTRAHVQKAFDAWTAAGKAARTIRHRRRVLRELYHGLDGAQAPDPTRGVKAPKPADPHPIAVSITMIQAVAASLKAGKRHAKGYGSDSDKTHARFLVRATTGQRPSQIMRATKEDVDLVRRIWFVRAGKGGYAIPLPLNADMVRAWRAFITAKAWGTFDARSFSKTIRRHGWPAGVRPYTLRHTFAIDHLLAGTDLGELQGLLGHRQIETTRKFYAPVLLALLKKTVGKRRLKLA